MKRNVYAVTKGEHRHEVLWEAWQRSGLSQKEFARELHMAPQAFSMLLNLQWIPNNPFGFTPEQQQGLYRWTGMLPEELWLTPSQDFLDAPEVGEMERIDAVGWPDDRMQHPDSDLGHQACVLKILGKLDPFTQRVIEQTMIVGKRDNIVGEDRALSREWVNEIRRKGISYLRDLARRGLIQYCAT